MRVLLALVQHQMDIVANLLSSGISAAYFTYSVGKLYKPCITVGHGQTVPVLAADAGLEVTIPISRCLTTCWPLHPSFSPLFLSDQIHHL